MGCGKGNLQMDKELEVGYNAELGMALELGMAWSG